MDISVDDRGMLQISRDDGVRSTLHPIWLREHLPDARILDPITGQRLIEAAELSVDLRVTHVDAQKRLVFSDGFEATIVEKWLCDILSTQPKPGLTMWEGDLAPPPATPLGLLRDSDSALSGFLDRLDERGFVVVSGVPIDMDGALEFARLLGPIRITNWGGLADVRAIANAYDLTMTPRHLEPHSDNPYRQPVPGYILLHCLTNDAQGGDSTLVDGFQAAAMLREQDPQAFATLTNTIVGFRYRDDGAVLENRGPLIELDEAGQVVQVRYSNRTETIDLLPPDLLDRYYRARQAFWALICPSSPLTLRFKLAPGELLMMDNYRLFHGRTAYRLETGSRHMRQCYMDRDIVSSRRETLRRRLRRQSA